MYDELHEPLRYDNALSIASHSVKLKINYEFEDYIIIY